MTNEEAVAAVRRGERVGGEFSLHAAEKEGASDCPHILWRTLFCVEDDEDVVECASCGRQMVTPCNFDEEYA